MRAFTLIEMIFVLIIIGILSIVAIEFIPDNTLTDNTKALKNLINEKKSFALGYEANMSDSDDNKKVCITFDKDTLNKEENNSRVKYFFKADISSNYDTICFDRFGRVYKNSIDDENKNLLHKNVKITLKYKNKTKTIIVHKTTGFVE